MILPRERQVKTCDIEKVGVVSALLQTSPPERDRPWRRRFYASVADASFACASPQLFTGPDGFPYFALMTPEPYKAFDSFCLCNLTEKAIKDGFGAAINPSPAGVDWVFSYGDLLTYQMFGTFVVEDESPAEPFTAKETLQQDESVLVGQPADSYLPTSTRAHIRRYLEQRAGLQAPGVLLMVRPKDPRPRQLVFSVYRRDFPSEEAFRAVLQGISWYLPRHYMLIGLDEPKFGQAEFTPL